MALHTEKKIERIKSIDKSSFYQQYYLKNKPVIIEDFAKDWAAIDKWDANYLCNNLRDETVLCSQSSSNKHPDFSNMRGLSYVPKSMSFNDYIKHICLSEESEIGNLALNRLIFMSGEKCDYKKHLNLDLMKDDFHVPDLISDEHLELGATWIQGIGTQSWLHNDPFENLYVQIRGTKKLILIDPKYSNEVYYNEKNHGYCEVDAFDPEYDKFPLYESIPKHEIILKPGEMLFLPIFWFHAVECLDVINITTNWWYRPSQLHVSPPSLCYSIQKLFSHCIEQEKDEKNKQDIIDVGLKIQDLLLSDKFNKLDDFYLKS